jgi:hypothetical protein
MDGVYSLPVTYSTEAHTFSPLRQKRVRIIFVVYLGELTTPLRRLKEMALLSALWLIISNQEA